MSKRSRYREEFDEVCAWYDAHCLATHVGWKPGAQEALEARLFARWDSLRDQYRALSWWDRLFVPEAPGWGDPGRL